MAWAGSFLGPRANLAVCVDANAGIVNTAAGGLWTGQRARMWSQLSTLFPPHRSGRSRAVPVWHLTLHLPQGWAQATPARQGWGLLS